MVALTAVALGFVIYPITEPGHDVTNSDWTPFATGAKIAFTEEYVADLVHRLDRFGRALSLSGRVEFT